MRDPDPSRAVPVRARVRGILGRLGAEASMKVWIALGLTAGICIPYFALQRLSGFPVREIPALGLDRLIVFDPAWTGVYLSVCALVPLSVALATRRDQLWIFSRALASLCAICFLFFLFLPTEVPRGALGANCDGLYAAVTAIDEPRNAFPSLHAGLTTLCLGFAAFVTRPGPAPRTLGAFWGAAILFATLATKQHLVLDIAAGGVLGIACLTGVIASHSSPDRPRSA